jgi:hypothetical protein
MFKVSCWKTLVQNLNTLEQDLDPENFKSRIIIVSTRTLLYFYNFRIFLSPPVTVLIYRYINIKKKLICAQYCRLYSTVRITTVG